MKPFLTIVARDDLFRSGKSTPGFSIIMAMVIAGATTMASVALLQLSDNNVKKPLIDSIQERLRNNVRSSLEIAVKAISVDDALLDGSRSSYWTNGFYGSADNLVSNGPPATVDEEFSDVCWQMLTTDMQAELVGPNVVNDHDLCAGDGDLSDGQRTRTKLVGPYSVDGSRVLTVMSLYGNLGGCPDFRNVSYLVISCGYAGDQREPTTVAIEYARISRRASVWNLVTWGSK